VLKGVHSELHKTAQQAQITLQTQLKEHSTQVKLDITQKTCSVHSDRHDCFQLEALGNENWDLLQETQRKEKEWKIEKEQMLQRFQNQLTEAAKVQTEREKIAKLTKSIADLTEQQAKSNLELEKV